MGRYGDALNPWGDLQAIARAYCASSDTAEMLIGVMSGGDRELVGRIEFNAHRVYGQAMLSHLTANWKQLTRIGDKSTQPVYVLRKQKLEDFFPTAPPTPKPPTRPPRHIQILAAKEKNPVLPLSAFAGSDLPPPSLEEAVKYVSHESGSSTTEINGKRVQDLNQCNVQSAFDLTSTTYYSSAHNAYSFEGKYQRWPPTVTLLKSGVRLQGEWLQLKLPMSVGVVSYRLLGPPDDRPRISSSSSSSSNGDIGFHVHDSDSLIGLIRDDDEGPILTSVPSANPASQPAALSIEDDDDGLLIRLQRAIDQNKRSRDVSSEAAASGKTYLDSNSLTSHSSLPLANPASLPAATFSSPPTTTPTSLPVTSPPSATDIDELHMRRPIEWYLLGLPPADPGKPATYTWDVLNYQNHSSGAAFASSQSVQVDRGDSAGIFGGHELGEYMIDTVTQLDSPSYAVFRIVVVRVEGHKENYEHYKSRPKTPTASKFKSYNGQLSVSTFKISGYPAVLPKSTSSANENRIILGQGGADDDKAVNNAMQPNPQGRSSLLVVATSKHRKHNFYVPDTGVTLQNTITDDFIAGAKRSSWFSTWGLDGGPPPTPEPTSRPTSIPTSRPTMVPTGQPTGQPSGEPTGQPSGQPSVQPSMQPSAQPSGQPSGQPTGQPSGQPSGQPTAQPSGQPTGQPSGQPSGQPTMQPTGQPSGQPSGQPTGQPTMQPTGQPSGQPSGQPTTQPTGQPSSQPTGQPSGQPTTQPTGQPSGQPTGQPSGQPTTQPTGQPSTQPTGQPSVQPTGQPSSRPTGQPSGIPTGQPTIQPTGQPSRQPSAQPTRCVRFLRITEQ